ncbi:MAG: type ISP restriction/modification enzyme, partial [Nitrospirota bacterium]
HDFKLKEAREKLKKEDWKDSILPYSYRPFDDRYICYRPELVDRDRLDIMQHFTKENLGLTVMRQYLYEPVKIYNYVFCVDKISDRRLFISNRGAGFVFPLYLYQKTKSPRERFTFGRAMMLFEPEASYTVRKPNLNVELIKSLAATYKKEPSTEEVFYYTYAILYSNIYRTKYAEFLKIDFPRVPFTKDYKLFKNMGDYGERLVELHLLKASELDSPSVRFQGKGNNRVEKLRYEHGKLYINSDQYFEGIAPEVWEYQIGGYQVCEKWLKDRKEKILSLDDIKHYLKIVSALSRTIEAQKKIDDVYPEVEKNILSFENN